MRLVIVCLRKSMVKNMAAIDDLINQISDKALRDRIRKETNRLQHNKKFGLVFEEHLPECTPLYDVKVKVGSKVAVKGKKIDNIFVVKKINNQIAICNQLGTTKIKNIPLTNLVAIAEFGDPIYPYLKKVDSISTAPKSNLWHELIEADNYHALQLLEYTYAGKVDCIYIDPPYNTGAKDWKYNNDYVDSSDSYRHSKWLSFIEKRLKLAKKLLNPKDSVLIVTIDEKEYIHLGALLEELFPSAKIQMISTVINSKGVARGKEFFRVNEYIYFVRLGDCEVEALPLAKNWRGNIKSTTINKVRWGSLMRSGSGANRADAPGCFYPIFISKDKKHFCGVGKVLPLGVDRHTIKVPNDQIALFPIHKDGTEGRWQYSRDKYVKIQKKGYVRISTKTKKEATLRYISEGWQKKVENGEIKIKGKNEDGSLIFDDDNYIQKFIPSNQWAISSHNATEFGSKLLQNIIGKRFPFPKSLYAVFDTLKFFVASKPDALIIDFFAGSGTTLHAVNLLNAEDNGKRKCIMITNNEVSDKEAEKLYKKGFHPGDKEWEKWGIAHYVTWPRTICSISGKDVKNKTLKGTYGTYHTEYIPDPKHKGDYKQIKVPDNPKISNMKMANGFKSNVIYFKLGFLDKNSVALGIQFKKLLPVLWMKANGIGKCPEIKDDKLKSSYIFEKNNFAVLLDEKNYSVFEKEVNNNEKIKTVFIVTDSDNGYHEMISHLNVKNTYQLYKDYLDNFRINTKG